MVDIAYDVTTDSFYGLATSGGAGTGTQSNTVVRFQMGGAVLSTHGANLQAPGATANPVASRRNEPDSSRVTAWARTNRRSAYGRDAAARACRR